MRQAFPLPSDFEEVIFLTIEDVDYIHEEVLVLGQICGYNRKDNLLGALGRPQTSGLYDAECDLIRLAAYYWHGIGTSHGYADGNKRTSLASAIVFLAMNGVACEIHPEALGRFIEELFVTTRFDLEILEDMLRRHSRWR